MPDQVSDPHSKLRAQLRAGRELLGMKQYELAVTLGVDKQKISRIESGETKSTDVLLEIKHGLERLGIRFTANGLEIVENHLDIIEGEGCYLKLLDDVYKTLKDASDKTLFIMFASDRASPPEVNFRYRQMRSIGILMRQLIEEGDQYLMGELEEYRTIPSKYFTNIVTLIYADKVAQVNGSESLITVQTDNQFAMREKKLFGYIWDTGKKPEISIAPERFLV